MAERQKHTLKTAGAALALGVTFALASAQPPLAQQVPPSSMTHEAEQDLGARFGLTYRFGTFDIGSNLATVKTTEGFAFLNAADARHLIVDLWGNPPSAGSGILGAIVPKDIPVNDMNGWAAILTYENEGYVSDTEAASIDYSQLLADMQAGIRENNPELKKQGYPTYELVGWAEPPHYDQAEHKLYWAQELLFEGGDASTLNYFVRILGRGGVLEMNVIGDMKALPEINQKAPTLLSMVNFKDGQRYDQFDATTDATAAYGLAGLIAGGVAAKAGLFKVILGILAASWKFIAIGVVALGGVLVRFFGARKG